MIYSAMEQTIFLVIEVNILAQNFVMLFGNRVSDLKFTQYQYNSLVKSIL